VAPSLPILPRPESPELRRNHAPTDVPPTLTPHGHDKPRLLLADDDATLRDSLGEFFVREGFAVELAASGLEAVDLLQRQLFDISVLDGHMPGLTGPQVLRRLLAELGPTAIPPTLLVSSDRTIEAWVRDFTGAGAPLLTAVDFVSKPVRLDALRRSIRQLLRRQPPQ